VTALPCVGVIVRKIGVMRRVAAVIVLAIATAWGPVSAQRVDTSLSTVLAKAAEYLTEYRDQLTYVMATERTKQTLTGGYSLGGSAEMSTAADVFFVYVPADAVWMAVRDVEIVDGRLLKERDNVRALLNSGQVGAARALKDRNARYNLGTIVRNFNEPTLALTLLDDAHRTRVRFARVAERGGRVTVSFVENTPPTLITNVDGTPAPSIGSFVIDAATGRIEKAELRVKLGIVSATLTTTFRAEPKLKLWVPAQFDELYVEEGRRPQKVTARAQYSDYSRFDVEVKIK
jgi:hypothetical protein